MSSLASVVAAVGLSGTTPYGGSPLTSYLDSVVAATGPTGSTPSGPSIDVLQQVVVIASIFLQQHPGGHCGTVIPRSEKE
jgi:hypothetical protein